MEVQQIGRYFCSVPFPFIFSIPWCPQFPISANSDGEREILQTVLRSLHGYLREIVALLHGFWIRKSSKDICKYPLLNTGSGSVTIPYVMTRQYYGYH